jgi:thiol-disulfide isomerase/thioredoxin
LQLFTRKNFFPFFLIGVLGIVLFVPNAKAVLLKAFLRTGLFNAAAKKETTIIKAGTFGPLSFVNHNGERINTTDLQGKTIFINFWASWCPPCVAEMGSVNALYNKLKNDPRIVFIIADTDNNFPAALSFMKENNYDLPVYEIASAVPENLFTGALPTTLVIDASGNIVQRHEGIANYDTVKMLEFLKSLL